MTYERAIIRPGAHSALMAHVNVEPGRETGGILVGYQDGAEGLIITGVSPPGPGAIKKPFSFKRDTSFLQGWLERRCEVEPDEVDYVGEWHVHHARNAPPSCVDRRSLWKIARKPNYPTSHPLLIIVEDTPEHRRVRGYCFTARPKRRCTEVVIVGEAGPPRRPEEDTAAPQ